ncbi:MAG TPA: hypothetical protein QF753_12990 [Victivallales bacterium]|nr:hypothetical protein [Victivallales bacterium]
MCKHNHSYRGHGSIGGIILVIIGVLALINIYYHISAPVWPCIIIAVGILIIVKNYNFKRNKPKTKQYFNSTES